VVLVAVVDTEQIQTILQVLLVVVLQLLDKVIEVVVVTKQDNMLAVAEAAKAVSVLMVMVLVRSAAQAVLENKMILTEQIITGQQVVVEPLV
jgi:hypothetical protein